MENLDKITQYIDNTLSEAERSAFEAEIKADKALAKEVAEHFMVAYAAKELAAREQKTKWMQELHDSPPAPQNNIKKIIYGLIALAILTAVGFWYLKKTTVKPSRTTTELYAQDFKYEPIQNNMGGTTDTTGYGRCVEAYNKKDFKAAISKLEVLVAESPESQPAIELLVKSYMNAQLWKEAENLLIEKSNVPSFKFKSKWLRYGVAIGQGKTKEAADILKSIIDNKEPDEERARERLNKLKIEN